MSRCGAVGGRRRHWISFTQPGVEVATAAPGSTRKRREDETRNQIKHDIVGREEGLTGSWDEARQPGGGSHGAGVEIEPARSRLRAGGGGGGGTGSGSEAKP